MRRGMQWMVVALLAAAQAAWGASLGNVYGTYNLIQLKETTVSSDDGQSYEGNTSPSVLLSLRGQWQPGYNITGGGTTEYDVVIDTGAVYPVTQVKLQTHFRGSQTLDEFYIEGSEDQSSWTEIGHWTGHATGAFNQTFTPTSAVDARYLRYRVPAGQYYAPSGDQNYGGPGLRWIDIFATDSFDTASDSFNWAYSGWFGAQATAVEGADANAPPPWNRGNSVAGTNDGAIGSGGSLGHNNASGWFDTYLELDLQHLVALEGVEIIWGEDRGKDFGCNNYTLWGSSYGGQWFEIAFSKAASRAGGADFLTIAGRPYVQFLRLMDMDEPQTSWDPTISVFEVQVFGEYVPEPGAAMLLALPALTLLRRRRNRIDD